MPIDRLAFRASGREQKKIFSYTPLFCKSSAMIADSPEFAVSLPAMASATIGTIREGGRL
jgi:hypothetical protein